MALSSGTVRNRGKLIPQHFTSLGGNVSYSIASNSSGLVFSAKTGAVEVTRPIQYFIGSGAVGQSYLTRVEEYLFQLPVSFYSSDAQWRVSPGFDRSEALNVARPIETSCLNCHASGIQSIEGTLNGYGKPPFREGGVGCERCHGSGEQHILTQSRQSIINPARLAPAERDSICSQCHLSGEVRVAKLGRDKSFSPGERLNTSVATFIWEPPKSRQVNGHVEELSRSRCKLASGDKLWCASCHDPHMVPAVTQRASWYRERCFACHNEVSCKAPQQARTSQGDDCVACHMPYSEVRDVQHVAYTDHTIPRNAAYRTSYSGTPTLVAFGAGTTDRDLAVASALVALRENNQSLGVRAFELLRRAWQQNPNDAAAGSQLAQLYDRMGQEEKACAIYEQLAQSPTLSPAAVINRGACLAKAGRLSESISLWQSVTRRDPAEESAWINLAVAQIQNGERSAGRSTLENALRFHPASSKLRELLAAIAAP